MTEIERIDVSEYILLFYNKAKRKNHDPKKIMEKILNKEAAFRRDWDKKLASQIHDLPMWDEAFRGAKRHLKFI
ncbi:MAG: hypothetical protein R3C61_14520 [Bacteroidia bacterium]